VNTAAATKLAKMDWNNFMQKPAGYIETARLMDCLGGVLSKKICERIRATGRLQDRLSLIIATHYELATPVEENVVDDVDRHIALSSAEELREVILRSGAIYWANAIANVVLAEKLRSLHEHIGEAVCALALANRDLSAGGEAFKLLSNTREVVARDGERCMAVWCRSVPPAIGGRVALRLSATHRQIGEPTDHMAKTGSVIIRRAAGM